MLIICFSFMKSLKSLKSVEIPTSVTKFGCELFHYCSSLTSITLHGNYDEVKDGDFGSCTSLSKIQLPSTVTKIGEWAFKYCSSLISINLENVKEYGYNCFRYSGITKRKYPQLLNQCW